MTTPEKDYTLAETAEALRVSEKTIRNWIKAGKTGKGPFVAHIRRGNRIIFTAEHVEALRHRGTQSPPPVESITTGRKKRAS